MSTTTLSTSELAELLDVTERQLRYVTTGPGQAYARAFTPELVRRLQVAASLAHAIPGTRSRHSAFPTIARLVLDHDDVPEPRSWAILKDETVSYVRYAADLALAVEAGAVVVKIDHLWPDVEMPA